MADYAELVKALRCCSKIDARNNGCDSCPYEYCGDDCQNLCGYAADAIEELQAAVPKLVSVEDEPPKENDRYLVRYKRDVNLGCDTYTVLVGDAVAGKGMTIDYALMFAKALFAEYWNDEDISVTIKKEVRDG